MANTDLVLACHGNELQKAALLLARGALVDQTMKNGATPLMVASIGGHTELVSLLLNYGAVVELEMRGGMTALAMAAFYRQKAVEDLLIAHGASSAPPHEQVALLLASVDVDLDLGMLLLESITSTPPAQATPPQWPDAAGPQTNSHIRPGYTNLFIGELGRNSNEESVRNHFRRFGDVDRVVVKHSPNSSFAFVAITGDLALIMSTAHVIDGAKVAAPALAAQGPHKSRSKEGRGPGSKSQQGGCRKIFVGGLSHHTKESALRVHFGQFGDLVDVVVMHDPGVGKPRGFGFVTFADPESALSVMATGRYHNVDGRAVEVKLAIPRGHMPVEGKPAAAPAGKMGLPGGPPAAEAPNSNWMQEASALQLMATVGGGQYPFDYASSF